MTKGATIAGVNPRKLTVGVCTLGRLDSLVRCIHSLRPMEPLVEAVIVVDDAALPPVALPLRSALGYDLPPGFLVIRNDERKSLAAGRNAIARAARTPYVLNLDDDALVVDARAIESAVEVLDADASVAAVALAQGDAEGHPFPPESQPSPVDHPAQIASFVGYGHVLRREAMLAVGGFREEIGINGEEKELSLRLLDAGWRVVYLPDAVVGHLADMAGRDRRRYLHQTVRNDVLGAAFTFPLPLAAPAALARLLRYFRMRQAWDVDDPGGFREIVRGLRTEVPRALRHRTPVKWSTLRKWRALVRHPVPYEVPGPAARES